jgi:preprotein translocase subunit YajC
VSFISSAYAQAAGSTGSGDMIQPLVLFGGMAVFMYFMMIRPQMKRQKETRAMLESLKVGDEVVTAGGMVGKITKMQEAYITLEIADGMQVVVQRPAVTTLLPKGTIKTL